MILVVNFGGQTCHLIARRIRDLGVYAEIVPHTISAKDIAQLQPEGIILSGGPDSVYEKGAPQIKPEILRMGLPVFGICYGLQLIAKYCKGTVLPGKLKEYGKNTLKSKRSSIILKGVPSSSQIWMNHGDLVKKMPPSFTIVGKTEHCPIAAFDNKRYGLYGVQFHPEVTHTTYGKTILKNFVFGVCKAKKTWHIKQMIPQLVQELKDEIGTSSVIMGVSGGVDSTVAVRLLHNAIGNRVHPVFIDHGLIRKNEGKEVTAYFKKKLKFKNFHYVDASKLFLRKLKGVTDPEKKRKIIGHLFIEVFEKKVKELERKNPKIGFLGQGTIYPDRIESAQPSKNAAKIKSHHNVTLPEKMKLKVVEPLKEFYKDEVRALGLALGIDKELIARHPFPGPGLAIRILGEITQQRLDILKEADAVYIEELRNSGYYDKTWQAFAALFPVKSVGVMGDGRTYEYVISLRAVSSIDAMTADWSHLPHELMGRISNRIVNEVRGVNRVVFDITSKPPGTIEYE